MTEITVPVKGMNCASCARTIENVFDETDGIETAEVNYATEKAKIRFNSEKISLENLSKKIEKYGYSLKIPPQSNMHKMPDGSKMSGEDHSAHLGLNQSKEEKILELKSLRNKIIFTLPITIFVFAIMIWEILSNIFSSIPKLDFAIDIYQKILLIIATVFLFTIGKPFLKGIVTFVKTFSANMDTLVGIGTSVAFIYSTIIMLFPQIRQNLNLPESAYFDVTIVVIGFITFGKYLESKSKLQTGEAIEKLIDLQAKTALIEKMGKEIEIQIADVKVGDIIIIKPGSKIPVDGEIIDGNSSIDESMINGEPMPVDKTIGDYVVGGTINKQGSFKFKAVKVGLETMLSNIIKLVENAQGSRAPIQKLADKISGIFVPIVLIISITTLILWLIIGTYFLGFNQAFSLGLLSFVGILVIACPCALGLATPTAIIVGVGKGASNGILIKNAESLEKLYKIDTIVFDKTGTLTKGKPELTDINLRSRNEYIQDAHDALQILATLESKSEHPIAFAVLEKAKIEDIELKEIKDFENLEGEGIRGIINDNEYYAGNLRLMNRLGFETKDLNIINLTNQGKTPIILASKKEVFAIFAIEDLIKIGSEKSIQELKQLGLKVIMLTGDDKNTAEYIAKKLGIENFIAEVLPQDKAAEIKKLQDQGLNVGMVGDGINDAPALALSNVGIAMATGTDIAIEASDITILSGDLSKITQSIKLSKATMRTIKQNLFWAFFYNIIGIPIASGMLYPIGIILNPAIAGFAMAFSSVTVVMNSLRLKAAKI